MNIPYVRTDHGYTDLISHLMENRTLFIGPELTTELASVLTMQLLVLAQSDAPISLYVNCYGGSVPAGLGVLDVVRTVSETVPVHTYCVGECIGVAIAIVAAGRANHRVAFSSARFSLYQEWYGVESVWGAQSQDHDERTRLMKVVEAALRSRTRLAELKEHEFSKHLTTLKFFDADLAVQYGIVDAIEGKVAMSATALPAASAR